jgi:hypothetical protein
MLKIILRASWWELNGNTLKTTKIAPLHPKEKNWDFQVHHGSLWWLSKTFIQLIVISS